jgi:hypothetical protein
MNDATPSTAPARPLAAMGRQGLAWFEDNAVLFVFVAAALAIRLHWNLEVHPPGDYIYSDMNGYVRRAEGIFDLWHRMGTVWRPNEYNGFYPYGPHALLAGMMFVFGKDNYVAMAVVYAIFGAGTVGYGYALARRVSSYRIVPYAVGALLVCYYPHISLGGYFLSEVPFTLCLTAGTFHLVRMIDDGNKRDAWACGIWVALGATLRPQILLSVALVGVFWLVWRKQMPRARVLLWLQVVVPVAALLVFSSWRLHYHTGRTGLISENGKFNQVFGRCHNKKITALPDRPPRRRTSFGPPPLIQLAKRAQRNPGQWPQLDPALQEEFEYRGYIGDDAKLDEFIAHCVHKTGWVKQVEYSVVNVLLLWRFNVMWPDSGKSAWQAYSRKWGLFVANVLAVPALITMITIAWRRFWKLGLLALHLWAVTLMAVFYFGDQRFRTVYDPIIIVLAFEAYAIGAATAWRIFKWARAKMGAA